MSNSLVDIEVCYRYPNGARPSHVEVFKIEERVASGQPCGEVPCHGLVWRYMVVVDCGGGTVWYSAYCDEHGGLARSETDTFGRFEVIACTSG